MESKLGRHCRGPDLLGKKTGKEWRAFIAKLQQPLLEFIVIVRAAAPTTGRLKPCASFFHMGAHL
jgi:hypothetical protein